MQVRRSVLTFVLAAAVVAACGGPTSTPTAPPVTAKPNPIDPAITISVPAEVAAGSTFNASWTGQETTGDFFVIVPAGATTWTETADSPYYNATLGNPAPLVAPKTPGAYEVWFLKGNLESATNIVIKARAPLTVK